MQRNMLKRKRRIDFGVWNPFCFFDFDFDGNIYYIYIVELKLIN